MMKHLYLMLFFLGLCSVASAQHELRWMLGIDGGVPWNSYGQSRSVLRGTIPSHQLNLNTGIQYRAFDRIGIELGVGQAIRKLRAVDHQFAEAAPDYKSVIHVKDHYLTANAGLQFYFPLSDDDFFVMTTGYAYNYTGSKGLTATESFIKGGQSLSIENQYQGSNHAVYGEIGYDGSRVGRSSMYIGLKANVGLSPLMKGNYTVTTPATDAIYTDHVEASGSYIGLNLKYYLTVLHKDKVERPPKEPKTKKPPRERLVDTPPTEIKNILKDTMVVEGRDVAVGQSMKANNAAVTIQVWDAEAIDGDSISLILNGEYILRNESLTAGKVELKAQLKPGKNYLVLYAHNQGKYPPNTAAIMVDDGIRKNLVALKSNLKTSGAIEITLGQ